MSLLLLNSYGKDDEDDHVVESIEDTETTTSTTVTSTLTTTTATTSSTTTITSAFSIVDYEHDDEDDTEQQENAGRAIINISTPPPVDSPPPQYQPPHYAQVATPPPSSPPASSATSSSSSHSTPIPTSPLLPSTPPTTTATSTTTTITSSTTTTTSSTASAAVAPFSPATSSLYGVTLQSSPFRCETYLPPEPTKPVADELQAKVVKFLQLKSEGKSLNDQIRSNKQTRNPDILDKLVEHFGIKEIDSNYPKDIFDPFAFSPSDFYDHIAAEQRRMEEKKPEVRTNIEFAAATAPVVSKATGDDKKKGSKWDNMEPKQQGVVTVVTGNAPSLAGASATTTNPYADYIQKKKREGLEAANNNKRPKK